MAKTKKAYPPNEVIMRDYIEKSGAQSLNPQWVYWMLGLLHAAHDASKAGYYHGLTKDRAKLDTVLVGPL